MNNDELVSHFRGIDWTFNDDVVRPGRHKIHLYPATMHASCVKHFLDVFKPDSVLDPFGGSGTVALECVKRGIKIHTNDLNPLARLIMSSKLIAYDNELYEQIEHIKKKVAEQENKTKDNIEKIKTIFPATESGQKEKEQDEMLFAKLGAVCDGFPRFKNIAYWFQPEVIISLQAIKDILPSHIFFQVCFSEVVRLVSNRRSGEFKLYRIPREKLIGYSPNVFKKFIDVLERNLEIVKSDVVAKNEAKITANDARTLEDVADDAFSLILTSPPYGDSRTTIAYGQFSRLSLQWLGLDDGANKIDNTLLGGHFDRANIEMFGTIKTTIDTIAAIDKKRAKDAEDFYIDLYQSFMAIDRKCKKKGYQVWIVGNRMVKGIRTPLDLFIKEAGEKNGYECLAILPRTLPYKTMPKQINATNKDDGKVDTMNEESIVIIQKL